MKEFYVIMQQKELFKNCKMIRPELG